MSNKYKVLVQRTPVPQYNGTLIQSKALPHGKRQTTRISWRYGPTKYTSLITPCPGVGTKNSKNVQISDGMRAKSHEISRKEFQVMLVSIAFKPSHVNLKSKFEVKKIKILQYLYYYTTDGDIYQAQRSSIQHPSACN